MRNRIFEGYELKVASSQLYMGTERKTQIAHEVLHFRLSFRTS